MSDNYNWNLTYKGRPGASVDGYNARTRGNKYGETVVVGAYDKGVYTLCDEGSYFVAQNGTVGTGITGIAAADAEDALEHFICLTNSNTDGKRIYLDSLKITTDVGGLSGTDTMYYMSVDNITRYTSGGTAFTPVNTNMDSSETSGATLYVGALVTAAASSSVRLISHGALRATISVALDEFLFNFGGVALPAMKTAALGADSTNNIQKSIGVAPVILGANQSFLFNLWGASQATAAKYEFELRFWVR
jgi:hypothetical protein